MSRIEPKPDFPKLLVFCSLVLWLVLVLFQYAAARETSLTLTSEPGDSVGAGQKRFFAATDGFFSVAAGNGVGVFFRDVSDTLYWDLQFAAPAGQRLTAGLYTDVVRFISYQNVNKPSMAVSGEHRGCLNVSGHFEIKTIKFASDNSISEFWATFVQRCNGLSAALTGEIRYNANVVVNVNAPPTKIIDRGETLMLEVAAAAADGRVVRLTAEDLPPGAVFTDHRNNTGTLIWKPGPSQKGVFAVTFLADNESGAANATTTTITVLGETALVVDSEPGAFIGAGRQLALTLPDAVFTGGSNYYQLYYNSRSTTVRSQSSIDSWDVIIGVPSGRPLVPGLYLGATGSVTPPTQNTPLLAISSNNGSCNTAAGAFLVKPAPTGFWVVFEHHCEGSQRALFGELRLGVDVIVNVRAPLQKTVRRGENLTFTVSAAEVNGRNVTLTATGLPSGASFLDNGNSTGAITWTPGYNHQGSYVVTFLADNGQSATDIASTSITVVGESSFAFDSDPGDFVGGGKKLKLTAADGSITAVRNYNNGVSLRFEPPSRSPSWDVAFAAPNNQPLAVGTYDGAASLIYRNLGQPGLQVTGESRTCQVLTGSFRVKQIEYGSSNTITAFWATFEQHCEGGEPALLGEVRYNLNLAVSITVARKIVIEPGRNITLTISAAEVNNRIVELTAAGLPPGANFTDNRDNTGTLSWSPGQNQQGVYTVTFQANNGQGGIDSVSTILNIAAPLTVVTSGNGAVTSTGVSCPGDCAESYANGSSVVLTATPSSGYQLGEWTGCDSTSGNKCTVLLSQARSVSASFTPIRYLLSVFMYSPEGTVVGSGIHCPGDCLESYIIGTNIILTAQPLPGYRVSQWGGCDTVSLNQCHLQIGNPKYVSVAFAPDGAGVASAFLPLRAGTVWTYRYSGDGSTLTRTVLPGEFVINGIATKVLQDSDGFAQHVTSDRNGILLHAFSDPSTGFPVTFSPPIALLSASLNPGDVTESFGTVQTRIGEFAYSASYTVQEFTNVAVPLRSFPALRLDGAINFAGTRLAGTVYLARNVGIVKEMEFVDGESVTVELVATNSLGGPDFDGDGKADLVVYREDGLWFTLRSSDGANTVTGWGGGNQDVPVMADFDGDGRLDVGIYRNGTWSILRSFDGGNTIVGWGAASWRPVPADYDGDGLADVAVYNNGAWSLMRSSDGGNTVFGWGGSAWSPVPADYDGDGKADIAVYNAGAWSIVRSSDGGNTGFSLGGSAWTPVPADYDGDGKADIAVYNGNSGTWSIMRSSDGSNVVVAHGGLDWVPVPGDYDGDGKTDIAVYNWSTGQSSIRRTSDGGLTVLTWSSAMNGVGFSVRSGYGAGTIAVALP